MSEICWILSEICFYVFRHKYCRYPKTETTFTSKTFKTAIINWPWFFVLSPFSFMKMKSLIVLPLMLLHFDPHYREGIQMLALYKKINPGKAAVPKVNPA